MCKTRDLVIMVVEPDVNILKETCDSLNRMGIEKIICVDSYISATLALRENRDVDIVVADFAIEPNKALGTLLCGAAKKKNPALLFVLISKEYSVNIVLDSFGMGAEDILDKTRKTDIEDLMGKWIELAKQKNILKGILNEPTIR